MYEPGTKTLYSDVDYMLLDFVIEQLTGSRLDDYLAQVFWQPMGLTHITYQPLQHGFSPNDCAATELNGNTRDGAVSFTGIRIGVAAAKGLAVAAEKPVAAVSTLEAMARNVSHADGLVVCAMDARRSQVYNALFAAENGCLTRLTPDRAISLTDLAEELRDDPRPKTVVGDGGAMCYEALQAAGIACRLAPPHLVMQSAASVALAAEEIARNGGLITAQALQPVYLRPPQAERLRDRQQKAKSHS